MTTPKHVSGTIIPLEWSSSDNPWRRCEAFCPIVRFTFVIWSDCTDVDAEKARIEADRAARILAAIQPDPEPAAGGCGYPCGYDCNGACFDGAEPQPVACKTCSDFGFHEHALQPCRDCTQSSAGMAGDNGK